MPALASDATPAFQDPSAPLEARVSDLLGRMTLDEKIAQLSGFDSFDLPACERLGIPRLRMTDGPLGVRAHSGEKATAFPSGILTASTFDTALAERAAAAMADETLALGRDMLLGPCVNIARVPMGGRNFESYGEDPFLASRMAEAFVRGLQGRKALASVKHYALNNQEFERMSMDVRASERAMHEIYLPAFDAAVRAGAWTVMAAYNKINGLHASENGYLLNEILKKRWGFKGFVVSDWGATHSTVEAANEGLDVEMPSGEYFGGGRLQKALSEGKVSQAAIDDKVRRVLRARIGSGAFDRREHDRPPRSSAGSPAHRELALAQAREGIVLLKNDGLLPLKARSVAVIGPNAQACRAGGGSSLVPAAAETSPLSALRAQAGLDVVFEAGVELPGRLLMMDPAWLSPPPGKGSGRGLFAEYFNNLELQGEPALARVDEAVDFDWGDGPPAEGVGKDGFSVRWTGRLRVPRTGEYDLAVRSDDGARLWVDGGIVIDDWTDHAPATRSSRARLEAGRGYDIRLEYYERGGGAMVRLGTVAPVLGRLKEAVAAAAKAQAALVFVGTSPELEAEGFDRPSMGLPEGQDELIEAVAKANKNTVVVIESGSPVLAMGWAGKVGAIVQAWFPGQEGGLALADILLGRVNPSGKLPVTWPKRWEDCPAFGRYPGRGGAVDYSEGIFVGYRHFDRKGAEPLFPFGHGLSYTSFAYEDLSVDAGNDSAASPEMTVSVEVRNSGGLAGSEVVQLYVREKSPRLERPPQELKGFHRLDLAPGEKKRAVFKLGREAFAHYDPASHAWSVSPGLFELRAGSSSRDIRLKSDILLK
jgi:beta-glucosidase